MTNAVNWPEQQPGIIHILTKSLVTKRPALSQKTIESGGPVLARISAQISFDSSHRMLHSILSASYFVTYFLTPFYITLV